MPRKKKSNVPSETPATPDPKIPKELLDQRKRDFFHSL
jgi:hypothetical protein